MRTTATTYFCSLEITLYLPTQSLKKRILKINETYFSFEIKSSLVKPIKYKFFVERVTAVYNHLKYSLF